RQGAGNFSRAKGVRVLPTLRLDTVTALRYNDGTVNDNEDLKVERERFSSDVMSHLDHLYRVALYLVKNEDEAKDCVQETCARALSSYRQFSPGSNLKAWLTRILYNFFFDTYHRGKRTVSVGARQEADEDSQDYLENVPADNPGPETQVLQREMAAKIQDALQMIPEEFRGPIVLVDMGDLSYAEAAEILSCPIGTVRSRLSRGRRLLQRHLSGYLTLAETG
ncbi:MAG: sigma-70 family RNA polymerase sigma factor, partial [Deltaproteobacteria bacterium]|nr:sigma-70 family RNA polymerase sigma factor [Deltaproteobacteria bacterium]